MTASMENVIVSTHSHLSVSSSACYAKIGRTLESVFLFPLIILKDNNGNYCIFISVDVCRWHINSQE